MDVLKGLDPFDEKDPGSWIKRVTAISKGANYPDSPTLVMWIVFNRMTAEQRLRVGYSEEWSKLENLFTAINANFDPNIIAVQLSIECASLLRSGCGGSPHDWAKKVMDLNRRLHDANSEENQVADLVAWLPPDVRFTVSGHSEPVKTWASLLNLLTKWQATITPVSSTSLSSASGPTVLYASRFRGAGCGFRGRFASDSGRGGGDSSRGN